MSLLSLQMAGELTTSVVAMLIFYLQQELLINLYFLSKTLDTLNSVFEKEILRISHVGSIININTIFHFIKEK